jgi:cell division protein FtsB
MMENIKSILLLVIILIAVVIIGYWAVVTLEPGNISVERQKQEQFKEENEKLQKEVQDLTDEIQSLKEAQAIEEEQKKESETVSTTSLKYQSLINDLQKLIDDNVSMKEKSKGTRVGTVQTFLNLYNNTSKRVDNDYGASTKTAVMNFQKAVSLTADGEAGPSTFQKMIEWLKKQ